MDLSFSFCGRSKYLLALSMMGLAMKRQIRGIVAPKAIDTNTGLMTVMAEKSEPVPRLEMI